MNPFDNENGKFQQYMQNFNRRVRSSGTASAAKIDHSSYQFTEFYRDSRHAFGTRFEVEKPNRDWIYGVVALVAACLAIAVMAAQL